MLVRGLRAFLLLAVLTGCEENKIVDPGPPDSLPFPETPDQLMSNLQTALARRDLAAYGNTIAPSFRFQFLSWDVRDLSLPHSSLNACEERTAVANLFSSVAVTNCHNEPQPAIASIEVLGFDPVGGWETVLDDDPLFPGTSKRAYDVQVKLTRSDALILLVAGRQEFYVVSRDSLFAGQSGRPFCQLAGHVEIGAGPKLRDEMSWGRVKAAYLTNQTPEAALIIDPPAGPPETLFSFDASGSRDPDGAGHPLSYRWRFDGGAWTSWVSTPATVRVLYGPTVCTVELEVRDGWGATDQASGAISIATPFADTADQLIANWRTAYQGLDINRYRTVIHPAFMFVFSPSDVAAGLFPTAPLTREQELAGSERLFSGQPGQDLDGERVAPLVSIMTVMFNPLTDWDSTAPDDPDFPNCGRRLYEIWVEFNKMDTGRIMVRGPQEFFVAARDSLIDGVMRPFYQLRGWRDYSTGGLQGAGSAGGPSGQAQRPLGAITPNSDASAGEDWTWGYLKTVYF